MGDHLLKRRLELGLFQKEAASSIGINEWTYLLWENDRNRPMIRMWPKIIGFLGYDPHGEPRSDSEEITYLRRRYGLSRKKLAQVVGCSEDVVNRLEKGSQ